MIALHTPARIVCGVCVNRTAPVRPGSGAGRRHCIPRAGDGSVQDLLSRDLKQVELTTAFDETPAAQPEAQAADEAPAAAAVAGRPSSSTAAGAPTSSSRPGRRQRPKSRRQRQVDMASAADAAAAGGAVTTAAAAAADEQRSSGPKRCKEAIDAGLEAFTAQRYGEAIELFNLALELPGNGAYRLSGSPREYACPSDAEERAALYNLACCYAQLGQREAALTCLDSVLESGFDDIKTLMSDPDLAPVQGPELQALVNKHTGVGGLLSRLVRRDREQVIESDSNKNKPWLLW